MWHIDDIGPVNFTVQSHTLDVLFYITRGSAIAERPPPPRSVLLEILAYCCTNNTNRSRVSLRSTFSNCHVLFRNLHTFVQASLN